MVKKGDFAIMKSLELLEELKITANDPATLKTARQRENAFTRKRMMPFPNALCFMLDMRKTTLQTRLNMYFGHTRESEPMSQQAFSKLRNNFDHSPFEAMLRSIVTKEYSSGYELPLWNGFHLLGVDGSYLQLPRTKELYQDFGTHGQTEQCPSAGISILFDLLHGWVLDPIITSAKMNERTECESHVHFLCRSLPNVANNSIILLDRGYPSLDLLETLQDSGVKFVMRCNAMFVSQVNNAPLGDSVATLKNGITVRIIKFILSSGKLETLVSNLFDAPPAQFPELYALRWGVEVAYLRFKQELCVEKFSGKTTNSIYQDFWASMVLLNSLAVFQAEANMTLTKRQAHKSLKHRSRARTSDLIITLRDRFIFAALCANSMFCDSEMERIIKTMARSVSPIRPGRAFPRRHKPFIFTNLNLKSHL